MPVRLGESLRDRRVFERDGDGRRSRVLLGRAKRKRCDRRSFPIALFPGKKLLSLVRVFGFGNGKGVGEGAECGGEVSL